MLRFFRDFVESGLPDELIVYAGAITTPDGMPVIALIPAYLGGDHTVSGFSRRCGSFGASGRTLVARMPYTADRNR